MFVICSLGDLSWDKISNNTLLSGQDTLIIKLIMSWSSALRGWAPITDHHPISISPGADFYWGWGVKTIMCIKPSQERPSHQWIKVNMLEGVLWPGVNIFILHSNKTFWGGHKNMGHCLLSSLPSHLHCFRVIKISPGIGSSGSKSV